MKPRMNGRMNPGKVVVLSGSGISAESGLPTFRDAKGLWNNFAWEDLASPEGWRRHPEVVLQFYNERRANAWLAQPNAAHRAIAALESAYEVVIVTQNVDNLHERAGSTNVIHVHGELAFARGTSPSARRYRIDGGAIEIGQLCDDGTQLRPDIVWFGEAVQGFDEARAHVASAARVLVVGTSLSVFPAASLVQDAPRGAEKVLVALEVVHLPRGFEFLQGKATDTVPGLAERWLGEAAVAP